MNTFQAKTMKAFFLIHCKKTAKRKNLVLHFLNLLYIKTFFRLNVLPVSFFDLHLKSSSQFKGKFNSNSHMKRVLEKCYLFLSLGKPQMYDDNVLIFPHFITFIQNLQEETKTPTLIQQNSIQLSKKVLLNFNTYLLLQKVGKTVK